MALHSLMFFYTSLAETLLQARQKSAILSKRHPILETIYD